MVPASPMPFAPNGLVSVGVTVPSSRNLGRVSEFVSFMGYVETVPGGQQSLSSETSQIFEDVTGGGPPGACYGLSSPESVWDAIRAFFTSQAEAEE